MKIGKIITILALSLILSGCYKEAAVNVIESEVSVEENNEDNENNEDMKNIIAKINEINIEDNYKSIIDLELRNSSFVKEYAQSIDLIKDFSVNNSLELIFEEPIQHRISRTDHLVDLHELLVNLQLVGAETVIYFTDEDLLNVELSISIGDNSYSHITYKASIQDVDQNFEFKDSKLNEFRSMLIDKSELNFDKVNEYVEDITNNRIEKEMVFFNKIDEDRYETIRIENNNCYYKLIYNPKL